jgi:carbonic anhydrase
LARGRLAYYRYPGSLATPPCSETVEWLLLTDPIQVADADITAFANVYEMNARPAQEVKRRAVLRSG